ncbi:MAG: hypothetical protein ACI38Q_04490 [Candidatus Bruticola sp.]
MVNRNRNHYGSSEAGRGVEGGGARLAKGRTRQNVSLRRRGRYGADTSGERLNVSGGRGVRSFRVSGRHYADMPGIRRVETTAKAEKQYRYLAFWKPCGVDVKFTGERVEGELDYYVDIPDVRPLNVLDKEAEGLMILTSNPRFRAVLTHPLCSELRTFLVQTENVPTEETIEAWHEGVCLVEGGRLESVEAEVIPAPKLPSRSVPIRERKSIPTAWLELRALSGNSRGVRKVSASLGYPVLRLFLWGFGPVALTGMIPGQCRDLRYEEMRWVESILARAEEPAEKRRLVSFGSSKRGRTSASSERVSRSKRSKGRSSGGFACREDGRASKGSRRSVSGPKAVGKKTRSLVSISAVGSNSASTSQGGRSTRNYGQFRIYRGQEGRRSASPSPSGSVISGSKRGGTRMQRGFRQH